MNKWKLLKCRNGDYIVYNPNKSVDAIKNCKSREEAVKLRKELNKEISQLEASKKQ